MVKESSTRNMSISKYGNTIDLSIDGREWILFMIIYKPTSKLFITEIHFHFIHPRKLKAGILIIMDTSSTIYGANTLDSGTMTITMDHQQMGLSSTPSATSILNQSQFSPITVMEHLQSSLKIEHQRRLEVEKELANLKKRVIELEKQIAAKDERLNHSTEMHGAHLRSIKCRIQRSLATATNICGLEFENVDEHDDIDEQGIKKIEFDHHCDDCSFHSKSDVSLILHKMNHSIVEQQYVLSSTDTHTNEKPLPCQHCEYSFTHRSYLEDHIRTKHGKLQLSSKMSNQIRVDSNGNPLAKDVPWNTTSMANATTAKSKQLNNVKSNSIQSQITIKTPSIQSLTKTSNRSRPIGTKQSGNELKCTFLDCNFETTSQDKLDFHMKAHINTKYKCPYCPYVSNTIIDIKRHIQKSKKHEGMKMYSCQKCGFGSDCDRMFKEHLRARHFGYEVHDTVVDYFIDEMFSNKNNKRPGTDDELAQAQLAQLKHQMQNPQFHQPPRHMTSNSRSSSHQTSSKKLATSLNNVISEGRKSNRVQSPSLATMIQEIDSSQALSPMETFQLITNYRQQNNATTEALLGASSSAIFKRTLRVAFSLTSR
ncbi:hypothetical protein BLOT_008645 [Blomia tropicalis]|nr:hypothetical protein BLOT_008645 [Blomia tropicalis]